MEKKTLQPIPEQVRKRARNRPRRVREQSLSHFGIISRNEAMEELCEKIPKIGPRSSSVMITGETGTGKELVSRAIHKAGADPSREMYAVNCSGFSETLIESELFGHLKGAFTGATQDRIGLFEQAHQGTLLLDEISAMRKSMQAKLLRALEEHQVTPVGSTESREANPRIISATNQEPQEMIEDNQFRADLYYRLNVVNLIIPPLRERVEDIPLLIDHFIGIFNDKFGHEVEGVTKELLHLLKHYDWPGNVRQLKNLMEGIILLKQKGHISPEDLPREFRRQMEDPVKQEELTLKQATRRFQKDMIESLLEKTGGDKKKAAEILDIDRSTLYRKLDVDQ